MKRFRNVSAIVTLLAGFITAVVMIINRYSLVSFLWILIGVMVCFYAVSRIICFIVDRKITKAEEQALPLQSKEEVAANLLDAIMKART